jgi:hypothetical protein
MPCGDNRLAGVVIIMRPFITVEALILQEKWSLFFSDEERDIARKRLREYRYKFNSDK